METEKTLSVDRSEAFNIDFAMLNAIGHFNEAFIAGHIDRAVYKKNVGSIISIRRKIRQQDWPNMSNLSSINDNDFEKNAIGTAPFLDDNVTVEAYKKAMEEFFEKNKDNKFLNNPGK